eukprot:10278624-Lingulodinium_polyedra.AAC.1
MAPGGNPPPERGRARKMDRGLSCAPPRRADLNGYCPCRPSLPPREVVVVGPPPRPVAGCRRDPIPR